MITQRIFRFVLAIMAAPVVAMASIGTMHTDTASAVTAKVTSDPSTKSIFRTSRQLTLRPGRSFDYYVGEMTKSRMTVTRYGPAVNGKYAVRLAPSGDMRRIACDCGEGWVDARYQFMSIRVYKIVRHRGRTTLVNAGGTTTKASRKDIVVVPGLSLIHI